MDHMRWGALIVMVSACSGGADNNAQPTLKHSLDLTDVVGFAIASQTGSRELGPPPATGDAGTCMSSSLFALKANGDMVVTNVLETTSKDMGTQCTSTTQSEQAMALFDAAKYEVISYVANLQDCYAPGTAMPCRPCSYVILRKSDGALFCGYDEASQPTSVHGDGDILYLGGNSLVRLDMTTDPPKATTVDNGAQTGDAFNAIDVDAANDALISGPQGERIFKAAGGLMNISATPENFQWRDPSGAFGYSTFMADSVLGGEHVQAYRLASDYTQTKIGEFDNTSSGGTMSLALATASQVYATCGIAAGTVDAGPAIVELAPSAAGGVCDNPNAQPVACTDDTPCGSAKCTIGGARHPLVGKPGIKLALGFGTQIFLQGTDSAGNGMILQIDTATIPETPCSTTQGVCGAAECCSGPVTPTTLLPAGYTLSAISLSRTGELSFAGLRNSDGASVVGNCVMGSCNVLSTTAPAVSQLQRIN